MVKVSIIMPVLNGMPFFTEALDSVRNQTLKEIEIIVVDAGSHDGTVEYTQKAMAEDGRVKLIQSDKKSHGRQCNLGMESATGEYIGFCESDDFLEPTMYEDLYALGKENQKAEIIVSNFFLTYGQGETQLNIQNDLLSLDRNLSYHQYIPYENLSVIHFAFGYMWYSIYQTAFLKEHKIALNESPGAAFQDGGFMEQVKLHSTYFYFTDKAYYHYRKDNNGSSTFKSEIGRFALEEMCFALDGFLQDGKPCSVKKLMIFLKYFVSFHRHYGIERLLKGSVSYEAQVAVLREKVLSFYNEMPEELQKQCAIETKIYDAHNVEAFSLFLKDLDLLNQYLDARDGTRKKSVEALIKQVKSEETLVLVGFGEVGRNYKMMFQRMFPEKTLICCDNNESYRAHGVISLEEAGTKYKTARFILTVETAYDPMEAQLLKTGVEASHISRACVLWIQEACAFGHL